MALEQPTPTMSAQIDVTALLDCLARLDGRARVIVDRKGKVLAASAEALIAANRSALDAGKPIFFSRSRKGTQAVTSRLLAIRGDEIEIAILEPLPNGEPVLVRATAIDEHHVCLVLSPTGQKGTRWIPEMQKLFGLTACEARIVADLMEGRAPQAIAKRRQNSIHTIRAHIRQCYQKISVRNREELFSRLASIYL